MASGGRTGLSSGAGVSSDSAPRAEARRLRLLLKAVARDTEVCEGVHVALGHDHADDFERDGTL